MITLHEYTCDKCDKSIIVNIEVTPKACPFCFSTDIHHDYIREVVIHKTDKTDNLDFDDTPYKGGL